jgi:hypothetical protein
LNYHPKGQVTMSTESALKIEASLAALPPPERERVALYGARLLFTEMESRLALAARELSRFERKYGMTLAHLQEVGLPEDAGLEAHEDYVEWSGWQATYDEASQVLETLQAILAAYPTGEGADAFAFAE